MIAGQYWVTPQLWIKGGIGFAQLQRRRLLRHRTTSTTAASSWARVGYEVISARNFAVDLQGRMIQGAYNGLDDSVTSGTVGIGINWY